MYRIDVMNTLKKSVYALGAYYCKLSNANETQTAEGLLETSCKL